VYARHSPLDSLRARARAAAARAFVPFSKTPEAVVLLLKDGRTVPGVRIESASFPLTISALQNALTSWYALAPGTEVVALAAPHPLTDAEHAFAADALGALDPAGPDGLIRPDAPLPAPGADVLPFLDAPRPVTAADGITLARAAAARAHVPASDFPVGCVVSVGGRLVPGCNVEFDDWQRTLCAERNALGTLVSYGLGGPEAIWLACLRGPCSPCGGCRQLLFEHAATAALTLPGLDGPVTTTPAALLPGAFDRAALGK
jgi:cytidine deaminase